MKKQFFYAAMAIAFMASCTSEDNLAVDPVNPTPEEDKVALNLGVATPAMTVGSRGTGMVGFVDDDDDLTNNQTQTSWDSQQLFIAMVNRTTNEIYKEDGEDFFNGLEFRAPSKIDGENNNYKNIRIYTPNSYNETTNQGTLQYKYYPVVGAFDFYGWHVDDAYDTATPTLPELTTTPHSDTDNDPNTPNDGGTATVTGIIINGSQDVLAAKTIPMPDGPIASININSPYYTAANAIQGTDKEDVYSDLVARQFGARTARNGFTPVLEFKHTLARLQFFVRSGKGSDAAINYMKPEVDVNGNPTGKKIATNRVNESYQISDANWTDDDNDYNQLTNMLNGAIYVTNIKVIEMAENINLNLIEQKASKTDSDNQTAEFTLMSTPEQANVSNTKELQVLVPVAPEYAWGYIKDETSPDAGDGINNENGEMATPIGESIMFLPVTNGNNGTDKKIKIQINLGQCLIDTENETTNPHQYTYYWDTPETVTLTLDATTLKKDGQPVPAGDQIFAPGKSYNVYITIYGRERIEVSASLVPWSEGGDINTDIEDGL